MTVFTAVRHYSYVEKMHASSRDWLEKSHTASDAAGLLELWFKKKKQMYNTLAIRQDALVSVHYIVQLSPGRFSSCETETLHTSITQLISPFSSP